MTPTFSIVIANWNYGHLVGAAIESALGQDYPQEAFDVVVVDDGSTDDSREVIARYANRPRFRAVTQSNRGHAAALEAGVEVSQAQYICFLDADDLCLPNKLAEIGRRIESIDAAPETLFLCHDLSIQDARERNHPVLLSRTWLSTMGANRYGNTVDPERLDRLFPFANPSGLVFGRPLIADILSALPPWGFARGPDTAMCLAAALKVWRIEYLHDCLGIYRVHGSNEVGRIVNGEYVAAFRWRSRRPRLLEFLERWVNSLTLESAERAKRTSLLRRFERISRVTSPSRGLLSPTVSVAVLGGNAERAAMSCCSIVEQQHPNIELLLSEDTGLGEGLFGDRRAAKFGSPAGASELEQMAMAYLQSSGDYIVFVRAGDRLDPEFIEQHLLWRQHGALVGLSCSDVRLATPNGALVHADFYANSGAWTQALQQVPPLATQLKDWVVSPLSACMFRRTAFLDCLFTRASSIPNAMKNAGMWFPVQLQHHTAGILRIRETLGTITIAEGTAATYGYLSCATDTRSALLEAPVKEAAAWFKRFYLAEQALFKKWLPQAWHEHFKQWLLKHTTAATR